MRTSEPARTSRGIRRPVKQDDDEDIPLSADHGKICETKDLYRSKKDDSGQRSWTTQMPDDLADTAENSETAKYALLLRNEKCYDGRRQFNLHSIVVQSPVMKKILTDIFEGYTTVTINVRRLEFQPPWHPFVHRWSKLIEVKDQLIQMAEDEMDGSEAAEKRDCIQLLYNVLKDELKDTVNTRDDLMHEGVITYDLIWTLYEPGSIIVSGQDASRVLSSTETNSGHQVSSQYIDWDGQKFGLANRVEYIHPFIGTCAISQLRTYPLWCHSDATGVRQALLDRAAKFVDLSGFKYKQYNGVAEYDTFCGRARLTVNSRIVIDTESWNSFNPNHLVTVTPLPVKSQTVVNGVKPESTQDIGGSFKSPLTEQQLLITNSTLRGYSCKDKKWMYFKVNNVDDIVWDENAFDDLVLPEKQKELIRSVAESQATNSEYFDDIIQGKGQGMILLLNGPPGVGKTLTAESVAEVMKVPLYYMSTVDLGSDATSIENALSKVFKMVTKWNAVLLLDEADVFLEKRTTHDLERNKLVSVFLRVLEYYRGILFMTTNRGETIDDAFQSRIHLRLTYNALNAESRRKIWANFIKSMSYKHDFGGQALDELAEKDLNGRQIKNLLKTAVLLAARKGEPLSKEHVEFVLDIDPQA